MSEEQVCKEIIEQVGYQEFYRYFQEKTTLIEQQRKEIERLKEREKMLQESFSDWKKGIEKERKYWLCERTDCCGRIKDSKKYSSLYQENKRLNNIINDLLNRQNEALRYIGNHLSLDSRYKHGNGDKELALVKNILNKHIKELKGVDKE